MFRPLVLASLITAGCAPTPDATVCQIVAQPDMYSGTRVAVTGTFRQGHHGALLVDPACPNSAIVLGSEFQPNSAFQEVVWANYLPTGRSITASIEGEFVYSPAPQPGRLLQNYRVTAFQIGGHKSTD